MTLITNMTSLLCIFLHYHPNVVRLHTHKTEKHLAGNSFFISHLATLGEGVRNHLFIKTVPYENGSLLRQLSKADWFSSGMLLPAGELPPHFIWHGQCLSSDWPLMPCITVLVFQLSIPMLE